MRVCNKHGKELILFCLEEKCQRPICLSCLQGDHKKHEFVELEEREKEIVKKEKENLINDIKTVRGNLEKKLQTISKLDTDAADKTNKCLKEVLDIANYFYNKHNEIKALGHLNKTKTDQEIAGLRENMRLLSEVERSIEYEHDVTREAIESNKVKVKRILKVNQEKHSGKRSLQCPTLSLDDQTLSKIKKSLIHEDVAVVLPEHGPLHIHKRAIPRDISSAVKLKCTGNYLILLVLLKHSARYETLMNTRNTATRLGRPDE